MLDSIEYLAKKTEFHIGDLKNLAVSQNQKDDMAKMFPKTEENVVSNADMLSQSFGGGQVPVAETPKIEIANEPIQITAIPNVQNSFNMESNPVDLNVNQGPIESVNTETPNLNIQKNDTVTAQAVDYNAPVIEPINSINSANNNSFNVSNQPNIFDNPINSPFSISQEEINKPLEVIENNNLPETNIFAQPAIESPIPKNSNNNIYKEYFLSDDIILAQIAIEESNVKHYEALAENSKKKIELLKRQVKNKKEDNLENTASNLFNNNGILDEEQILGESPMPTLRAA